MVESLGLLLPALWVYSLHSAMKRHNKTIEELIETRREMYKWKKIAKLHGYEEKQDEC